MDKKCKKCNQIKEISYFGKAGVLKDGNIKYSSYCKECKKQIYEYNKEHYIQLSKIRYQNNREEILGYIKIYQKISIKYKEWRKNNREYLNTKSKEWIKNNKDRSIENQAKWRINNKEYFYKWAKNNPNKVKQYDKKSKNKQRQNKPWIKAWRNQLEGTLKRLKQNKTKPTIESLGYSAECLKKHIESLWDKNMNWGNYGKYIGCWEIDHKKAVSKFDKDTCVSVVNALDNLQPLWVIENRIKYNK